MFTARTVREIAEYRRLKENPPKYPEDGFLLVDSFEDAEPYTVRFEEDVWEMIEKKGVDPMDYPDETLVEIATKLGI